MKTKGFQDSFWNPLVSCSCKADKEEHHTQDLTFWVANLQRRQNAQLPNAPMLKWGSWEGKSRSLWAEMRTFEWTSLIVVNVLMSLSLLASRNSLSPSLEKKDCSTHPGTMQWSHLKSYEMLLVLLKICHMVSKLITTINISEQSGWGDALIHRDCWWWVIVIFLGVRWIDSQVECQSLSHLIWLYPYTEGGASLMWSRGRRDL